MEGFGRRPRQVGPIFLRPSTGTGLVTFVFTFSDTLTVGDDGLGRDGSLDLHPRAGEWIGRVGVPLIFLKTGPFQRMKVFYYVRLFRR